MKLPRIGVTKLNDRSKIVINLRKEPGSKAYRVYDPVNKAVQVSRDVVFDEAKGWNRSILRRVQGSIWARL